MARRRRERRTDQELLAAAMGEEPAAFTAFYERHVDLVLAYLRRRTSNAEVAADLMAETFAAALLALHEHTSRRRGGSRRRGCSASRVQAVRELPPRPRRGGGTHSASALSPSCSTIATSAGRRAQETDVVRALADVLRPTARGDPAADHRRARLRRDRLAELGCSEAVVRKRVSRGLATLRARVEPMQ